jgi:Cu/Ag efflux pump CusA
MGHFNDIVKGIGATRKEAQNNACSDFLREQGERYDIRDVKVIRKIRDVPPKKILEEKKGRNIYITMVDDVDAPKDKWLGEWEFDIHSHA